MNQARRKQIQELIAQAEALRDRAEELQAQERGYAANALFAAVQRLDQAVQHLQDALL